MGQLKSSEVIFLLTLLNRSQCSMEVGGAVLEQFACHDSLIGGDVIAELWVMFFTFLGFSRGILLLQDYFNT